MNLHSGTAAGQGNSVFRSRDALHMVRVSCFLSFLFLFLYSLPFLSCSKGVDMYLLVSFLCYIHCLYLLLCLAVYQLVVQYYERM